MKVIIKETGAKEELCIIDPKTGCDYIADFIGNVGGFRDFEYNEDEDAYETTMATFSWWEKVVSDNQALDYRIADMKEQHGADAVNDVISGVSVDLEDHASAVNTALDEAFGE